MAARYGNEQCIGVLVKHGANTEAKDKDGKTPMVLAAWKRHCNVIRILIKLGAKRETAGKKYSENIDECLKGKKVISYLAYTAEFSFQILCKRMSRCDD